MLAAILTLALIATGIGWWIWHAVTAANRIDDERWLASMAHGADREDL